LEDAVSFCQEAIDQGAIDAAKLRVAISEVLGPVANVFTEAKLVVRGVASLRNLSGVERSQCEVTAPLEQGCTDLAAQQRTSTHDASGRKDSQIRPPQLPVRDLPRRHRPTVVVSATACPGQAARPAGQPGLAESHQHRRIGWRVVSGCAMVERLVETG
jgi:hypothetical protein